jgi:broad specificity phosphatase PhoE
MVTGPTIIHLIRHGEVHNPQQILYGRLPRFGLSDNGRRQAEWSGRHLSGSPLAAMFSSPMLRARQTAQAIRGHHEQLAIRISVLLNEVCTSFEGRPGTEVDTRGGDIYTGAAACFEQPQDIVARTQRFIARMRKHYDGRQVAAVTHGDIITFMVLWAKGFDLTPENKNRLKPAGYPVSYPAHASITTLTYPTTSPQRKPQVSYRQPALH